MDETNNVFDTPSESVGTARSSVKHRFILQIKIRPNWKPIATDISNNINDNHQVGLRILLLKRLLTEDGKDWRTDFLFVEKNGRILMNS